MRFTVASLALVALVTASPRPGGVTESVAPSSTAPYGCSENYSGSFSISQVNVTSSNEKRALQSRQDDSSLTCTLSNGVLMDDKGRTGYIAGDNQQLQFDDPPQAGAMYTSGFSICSNGSLAIGGDVLWVSCPSGDFYNLYLHNDAPQCFPIYINVIGVTGPTSSSATASASTGAPTSTAAGYGGAAGGAKPTASASGECTIIKDGQPQCTSAAPKPTGSTDCTEYKDGQPQCSTAAAPTTPSCSEYKDGQPQCTAQASAYHGPTVNGSANALALGREMLGLAAGVLAVAMF